MASFEAESSLVKIKAPDDILACAKQFQSIAHDHGLRVLPWHNLGSTEPMVDANGEPLCSTVFGWSGEVEWWHGLARRNMCPLADLCRYHAEPFWSSAGSGLTSRYPTPYLASLDMSWMWSKVDIGGIMAVPVHMQQGQVACVGFLTYDPNYDFEKDLDLLIALSREFVTSYSRIKSSNKRPPRYEPLTAREIDCLNWAFIGKTDRDIAEITGRSYATVRFYMSAAATKLGTVNRAQTLARAAALGYFEIAA